MQSFLVTDCELATAARRRDPVQWRAPGRLCARAHHSLRGPERLGHSRHDGEHPRSRATCLLSMHAVLKSAARLVSCAKAPLSSNRLQQVQQSWCAQVRETFDFSARCQGSGSKAGVLLQLAEPVTAGLLAVHGCSTQNEIEAGRPCRTARASGTLWLALPRAHVSASHAHKYTC